MKYDKKFGICFSGGGARSASFCSGVLCQLIENMEPKKSKDEEKNEEEISLGHQLPKYFSCVSGGGYVGSSFLHWARHKDNIGRDVSEWSGDYFKQFHENISYIVSFNPGCKKGLPMTLLFIGFLSAWFISILLEVMCETFVFYKFIAYLLWPNGVSTRIGLLVPSLLDYNFTEFHVVNHNSRPVVNPINVILIVCIIVLSAILKAIISSPRLLGEDKQCPRHSTKKCSTKLCSIIVQTLRYFLSTFLSMFIGVYVSAVVHYEWFDQAGGSFFLLAPALAACIIAINIAMLLINQKCHCTLDRVIAFNFLDMSRILSMLTGGYLIFWNASLYDDEEVLLFFHFSNREWYHRYDNFLYGLLFFFPFLVFFVQNTFSEFWEDRLAKAFYKEYNWAIPRMLCTLCCRTSYRLCNENEKDWIYPDEPKFYDTELPIYDSVCTVYWQRASSMGDSSIMTFSSDGRWYNYQSSIKNVPNYTSKWYYKDDESGEKKLVKFGSSRLRLSKVMALSGGAISLWMGSFFEDKPLKGHIFGMFGRCLTHLGASMGGWIRTTPTTSYDPLFIIIGACIFMLPVVLMLVKADDIANTTSPFLASISWFIFFMLYFIIWNLGRMDNTRFVKLFEYFYYPFKLNFLIGEKTWITHDPPIDRVYLSDGGHKDNYALTSLILRRRCEKILICEGSRYDPALSGLLQAFYWCDCYSDCSLSFYYYKEDNKEDNWVLIKKDLYEDFFRQHKKNETKTYEEKHENMEKIKNDRREWSQKVLSGAIQEEKYPLGKSPYCWRFKVTYGDKKGDADNPQTLCCTKHSKLSVQAPSNKYSPDENIKEAFMWFVAPPIDGELVENDKLTPKSQCVNHIVDGNLDVNNLSGCCCDCCHMKCCSGKLLGKYPHFSTINQALTPSQNSALHVAGTLAAEKALKLSIKKKKKTTELKSPV